MDRTGEFQSILKRIAQSAGRPLPETSPDFSTAHSRYMNDTLQTITSHFQSANATLTKLEGLVTNRSYTSVSSVVVGDLDPVSASLTEYSRLSASITSLCNVLANGGQDSPDADAGGRSNQSERMHYKVMSQSIMRCCVPPSNSGGDSPSGAVPSSRDGGFAAPLFMRRALSSTLRPADASAEASSNLGVRLKAAMALRESVLAEQADRRRHLEGRAANQAKDALGGGGNYHATREEEGSKYKTIAGASSRAVREIAASSAMFAEATSPMLPPPPHPPQQQQQQQQQLPPHPQQSVLVPGKGLTPFVPGVAVAVNQQPLHPLPAVSPSISSPPFVPSSTTAYGANGYNFHAVSSSHLPPPPAHNHSTNVAAYHPTHAAAALPRPAVGGFNSHAQGNALAPGLGAPPFVGGFAARAYGVAPPPMYAPPSAFSGGSDAQGTSHGGGSAGPPELRRRGGGQGQPAIGYGIGQLMPEDAGEHGGAARKQMSGVQTQVSRGPSLRYDDALTLERGLAELSGAFGRMAQLVQSQGEVVCKIEDDVTTSGLMVEDGYESVLRTHEIKRGNRALIIKVFAVVIFIILLVRFTIARPTR